MFCKLYNTAVNSNEKENVTVNKPLRIILNSPLKTTFVTSGLCTFPALNDLKLVFSWMALHSARSSAALTFRNFANLLISCKPFWNVNCIYYFDVRVYILSIVMKSYEKKMSDIQIIVNIITYEFVDLISWRIHLHVVNRLDSTRTRELFAINMLEKG